MQPTVIPLVLDERPSIVQAAELHRTLSAMLAQEAPIALDGAGVKDIDSAALQLLVSLWKSAADQGVDCTWQSASEPLVRAASLIGVAELIGLERAAT